MPYCSVDDVRNLTGLSGQEISDAMVSGIIAHATSQLNADIQVKWWEEPIRYLDSERRNKVDGSNKVFWTRNYPIGDADNDGSITVSDIVVYSTSGVANQRATYTVSGIIDSTIGKYELTTAPQANESLRHTYFSSYVDMATPHSLVKLACIQLAAALCFTRIDAKKVSSFRVGKISVTKQSEAFRIYNMQYISTINRIRSRILKMVTGDKEL